ncbi:lycopene cyclase domain protein [Mycobacterium xenopi 3993]|nr:lycopene cyclase domain protein [Mycobacterium xenopi 3993]
MLMWCHTHRRTDPRVRAALVEQHAVTRKIYDYARGGIAMLQPRSRPCVAVASTLYSEILDRIEDIDFAVFSQRATVGTGRRLQVAGAGLLRAWAARLRGVRANHGPLAIPGRAGLLPGRHRAAGDVRRRRIPAARRLLAAVLPVAAVFVAWDVAAIAAHVWTYSPRFTTGVVLPGRIPIEEVLFFLVIPLCGLLTYNAVSAILGRLRRIRIRSVRRS